jgi:hypothetical protein
MADLKLTLGPQPQPSATITISLDIENTYEDGEEVVTYVRDAVIPAPPPGRSDEALSTWADELIFDFTGTGRPDGDSWYDVIVTACSDPSLVGRTFEFGY